LAEQQATFTAEQRAAQDEQRLLVDEEQLQKDHQKSEALEKHASEVERQANALQQRVDILQAELHHVRQKETKTIAQRAQLQEKLTLVLAQTRAVEGRIHQAEAAAREWQRRLQESNAQKVSLEKQFGQVVQEAERRASASKVHGTQLTSEIQASNDYLRASQEAVQHRETTLSNAVLQIQNANSQILSLRRQLDQQAKLEAEARLHAVEDLQRAPALTGPVDFQDMTNPLVSGDQGAIGAPFMVGQPFQFQQQNLPQQQFQELPWQSPSQNQQLLLGQPQPQQSPLLDASSGLGGISPLSPVLPNLVPPLQVTPSSMQLTDGGGSDQQEEGTLKRLLGRVLSLTR